MLFLRSFIFFLLFTSMTIVMGILGLPVLLAGESVVTRFAKLWCGGTLFLLRTICGVSYEFSPPGISEHLNDGLIIASRHESTFETIALFYALPRPVFVMKKELRLIPIFGWYVARVGSIMIDRGGSAKTLMKMIPQVQSKIAEGHQIVIFPQGTRVQRGQKGDIKPGIAAIYKYAKAPVIPLSHDSGKCWGKGEFVKRPGVISFKSRDIVAPGLDRQEFLKAIEDGIR